MEKYILYAVDYMIYWSSHYPFYTEIAGINAIYIFILYFNIYPTNIIQL